MATLDTSVIICAYTEKRWDALVAAVGSLKRQTTAPGEIIIVIDHNPTLLSRALDFFENITVIANSEMPGLSGARNSGVLTARGNLIAFLDDDATAEPDWLNWLIAACRDSNTLGAVGKIEPLWVDGCARWFPEEFYWVVGCSYRGLPETAAEVRNLVGGCMCLRREVFEMVGGFRTGLGRVGTIPLGCEETELCIRARQRWPRARFVYEPHAVIHHIVPRSRLTWQYYYSRCYSEGLSKATMSRLVGTGLGLASERTHALRILPKGVLKGLQDAFVRRDWTGLARAGAIVGGLAVTTFGFLHRTVRPMAAVSEHASSIPKLIGTR